MNKLTYTPNKAILDMLRCAGHERDYGIYVRVPSVGLCEVITIDRGIIEYDLDNWSRDLLDCIVLPCRVGDRLPMHLHLSLHDFVRQIGDGKYCSLGSLVRVRFCGRYFRAFVKDLCYGEDLVRVRINDSRWECEDCDFKVYPGSLFCE